MGGEPTLQLTSALVIACQAVGFEVALKPMVQRRHPKKWTGLCESQTSCQTDLYSWQ